MSAPGNVRFANWLRRYLGVKGGELPTVLPDVMPVVNLQEEAPEQRYYRGERRWVFSVNSPAVAGQYSFIGLSAPAAADRLTIIERVGTYSSASLVISASPWGASGSTALPARSLDVRANPDQSIVSAALLTCNACLYTASSQVAAAPTVGARYDLWNQTANVFQWSPYFPAVILDPGGPGLVVMAHNVNTAFEGYFLGYDVPLHGSEED